MVRPYKDIAVINNSQPINNKKAICSTMPTGYSAKRIVRPNYPVNLTITNIERKYGNRFYNGILVSISGGDLNGGTSLS